MSAFDKVIGYETIKTELLWLCDMIRNKEFYESFGAKMPHGLILYGNPGLGKTFTRNGQSLEGTLGFGMLAVCTPVSRIPQKA